MTPKGTILFEGELAKAGSGLLKNKFKPVHAVIHSVRRRDVPPPCTAAAAMLSVYDDAAHTKMKGSRLQLDERASARVDEEEACIFYVEAHDEKTSVAQETITQSYTSVAITARFKAASPEQAQEWIEAVKSAISGAVNID